MGNYYPLVSVIIPTFNRRKYLQNAVKSVLDQTYANIEIIIVDDGSTDGTDKMVAQFSENIKYIWQPNKGVAFARNEGIKKSTGEFVAFLDSDDSWISNKLEKQMKLFTENEQTGLVYSDYFREEYGERQPQTTFQWKKAYRGDVLLELLQSYFVRTSTVVVKKSLIQRVGLFDQRMSPSEDYDMWLRLAQVCCFDYVDDPLVIFRINKEGISKRDPVYSTLTHLAVLKKFKSNNKISKQMNKIITGQIREYFYQGAILAHKSLRNRLSIDCLIKAYKVGFFLPNPKVLFDSLFHFVYKDKIDRGKKKLVDYSNIPYLFN
ncbi:MAG: glycosyltransferase [Candidatus Omnitrophota bacterium]